MKRLITAILAAVMVISAAACSEKADTQPNDSVVTADDSSAIETEPTSEEDIRRNTPDDIPVLDFEGYEFRMYTRNRDDFVSDLCLNKEEESGDVVEDSIYRRNKTVEERFNITLSATYWDDPTSSAKNLITADDDSIDLVLDNALNTGNAIPNGYYLAWDNLTYINFEKPWYIKNAINAMSINNHTYMMAGEFNLSLLRFTYCMYYNKVLAEDLNINDLYDRVVDMKWTYDSLYDTAAICYSDINGNGTRDDEDRYGLATDFYGASTNFSYALGVKITENDSDGIPQLVYYNEKTVDVFDKIWNLLFNNEGTHAGAWGTEDNVWKPGNALFVNAFFQSSGNYRDLQFDFGILPYPMYDEKQDGYRTHSNVAFTVCAFPITTRSEERSSAIVEALQAESWKQVIPAYYETALKVKYSRDDIAAGTLDLILAGRYLDFGIIYDQNSGCGTLMQQLFSTNKNAFTSTYEKKSKSIEKHYSKLIDKICELDG